MARGKRNATTVNGHLNHALDDKNLLFLLFCTINKIVNGNQEIFIILRMITLLMAGRPGG